MKVLVLGGTQFIGRHVVEKLFSEGHDITLLNRGKSGPDLFPDLPLIKADRRSDDLAQDKLLLQDWDAVVDLTAYFPKEVTSLLSILTGRIGRYVFCSTISTYAALGGEDQTPILSEDSPLHDCTPEEAVDTSMSTYGQRKAECERVIQKQMHEVCSVIIRPSVVYGAFDHTDRFAYWIKRASDESRFILPDAGLTITQLTYAPDLARAFAAALTSVRAIGIAYNIAESDPRSLRDKIDIIGKHLNKNPLAHAVSATSEELLKAGVQPWLDLPLWMPQKNLLLDTFRSRRDLEFVETPIATALADATDTFLIEKREPKVGLSRVRELELFTKIRP